MEKLIEIYSKFSNNHEIRNISNSIINEISKLKGQDTIISDNLLSSIQELKELHKQNKYNENKIYILACLEKINVFTTGQKLITLMNHDREFLDALFDITNESLNDKESNNFQSSLIQNELAIISKLTKNTNDPNAPVIEVTYS